MSRQLAIKIGDFALFQLIWWLCVLGREAMLPYAFGVWCLRVALSPSRSLDLKMAVGAALVGVTIDAFLIGFNVMRFDSPHFPTWLALLWLTFPMTLNHSLRWMADLRLPMQMLVGAFGGASSYLGGYALGAVELPLGFWQSATVLAVVWALLMPLFLLMQRWFVSRETPPEEVLAG